MQLRQAYKTSLIVFFASLQGCSAVRGPQNFGVPYPPGVAPRVEEGADLADRIQSPGVTGQQETANSLTAFDAVQLGVWPAVPGSAADQAASGIWLVHPTLPVPSYVEVTRLDNGRTILARIAGRLPGAGAEFAALSDGLARQLQLGEVGQAAFRIRRVNPPEADRVALRAGHKATDRLDTPEFLLAVLRKQAASLPDMRRQIGSGPPTQRLTPQESAGLGANPQKNIGAQARPAVPIAGQVQAVPVQPFLPEGSRLKPGWFVQIAALSNGANARALATKLGGETAPHNGLFRVLIGPYPTEADARAALGPLAAKGYPDARIIR